MAPDFSMADFQMLVEMGYDPSLAVVAAQQPGGMDGALDWLNMHQHHRPAEKTAPGLDHDRERTNASPQVSHDPAPAYTPPLHYHGAALPHGHDNKHSNPISPTPPSPASQPSTQQAPSKDAGAVHSFFKRLGGNEAEIQKHTARQVAAADLVMQQRWGPPGSARREIVARYWRATRMEAHWTHMAAHNPHDFQRRAGRGYCEPIPTAWVVSNALAAPYPEGSTWENAAEERLYYVVNHCAPPDGEPARRGLPLRPLHPQRDRAAIVRRGNERSRRAHPLDPAQLAAYGSRHEAWMGQSQSAEYSGQVDHAAYGARARALHELAEGLATGVDHLETMLLIDVSGSMAWDPRGGVRGPDGVTRWHDQPCNIALVEHLVHRALFHMAARARRQHPQQRGIDTVIFSSWGRHVGQLTPENFRSDWARRVPVGGGTQVMQGWQAVKRAFFEQQHAAAAGGHGVYDPVYGWQPTPGMPKLSLLVFLDGEAADMDEFELELLGETWAYVTVALVGMEGCPHHHSHAIELERVARFNPHVGFFDVHGRVCERLLVEDLLKSVYPVDPPAYEEIVDPKYDLPDEKVSAAMGY